MRRSTIIENHLEGETLKLRADGLTYAQIAKRLTEICGKPISRLAVSRYMNNHAPSVLHDKLMVQEGVNAYKDRIEQLKELNAQLLTDLRLLRKQGEMKIASAYYNQLHRNIELQSKLLGDISDGSTTTVNILTNPHITQLTQIILEEVDEDTRKRIIRRLEAIEGGADGKE